eukprot:9889370-Karenia_brevis.AAC.1
MRRSIAKKAKSNVDDDYSPPPTVVSYDSNSELRALTSILSSTSTLSSVHPIVNDLMGIIGDDDDKQHVCKDQPGLPGVADSG